MSYTSPWKQDFPIFSSHAQPFICYLDNAATTFLPKSVADAMYHYQCYQHANSHRGLYRLSAKATQIVEDARSLLSSFLNASSSQEIIFTAGTTEAINLVAHSFVRPRMHQQANILVSQAEHHANFLPWQALCAEYGCELRVIPITSEGEIDVQACAELMDENTVLVAITHVSNVLGVVNPIKEICQMASKRGILSIVDGAQGIVHCDVDVLDIGCDFYAFSAHKLYGPTGIGVLYAKHSVQHEALPFILGGGIVQKVTTEKSEFIDGPLKFEAGSHHIAAIVGMVEAIDYLEFISWRKLHLYTSKLNDYLQHALEELPFIDYLLPNNEKPIDKPARLVHSFTLKNVHSHDVASILDSENIAVRAGHHCTQPLHQALGVKSSVRASIGMYNTHDDVDRLVSALANAHNTLT
ncbi:aminotransferase class V-fold PLP-dependent enzyme [Thalassotalea fusca]